MAALERQYFESLDQQDSLACFRSRFELEEGLLYFNGNSLGAMPSGMSQRLQSFAENEWGRDIVRGWNTQGWYEMPQRVGDKIAPLIGADAGEVIVADTTSINIFKLAVAALKLKPGRSKIITTNDNFPTDIYILQGLVATLPDKVELMVVDPADLETSVDENTALVLLTPVNYKSGALFNMAAVTTRVQQQGALMLWDLSHSCGAHPVALNAINADFAVGCGYKFLNGGPGAPAYLFVAKRWQADIEQPLTGWKGHANPFAMSTDYVAAEGITRMLCGTHPVTALTCLETAIDIFSEADMEQVTGKSRQMGDLFIELMEATCKDYDLSLISPRDASLRGSQVSFKHNEAYALVQALIERKVICDFRAPDVLRFGITPLYQRYVDVWDAVAQLQNILESGAWRQERFDSRSAVT